MTGSANWNSGGLYTLEKAVPMRTRADRPAPPAPGTVVHTTCVEVADSACRPQLAPVYNHWLGGKPHCMLTVYRPACHCATVPKPVPSATIRSPPAVFMRRAPLRAVMVGASYVMLTVGALRAPHVPVTPTHRANLWPWPPPGAVLQVMVVYLVASALLQETATMPLPSAPP